MMERERFQVEIEKMRKQLLKTRHVNDKLVKENDMLQAEVDKIYDRFDILDL